MNDSKPSRAPIELKVEYKKLNTFFADYAKNISKGGTFIKTERPLPVGTEFVFKLALPRRPQPFELRGAVIWTNQAGAVQMPKVPEMGMGIRFVFAEEAARGRFEAEADQLMAAALGVPLFEKLIGRRPRAAL